MVYEIRYPVERKDIDYLISFLSFFFFFCFLICLFFFSYFDLKHGRKKKSQDQSNTFINLLAKVLLASPCNCKSCCFVQIKAFNQLRRWLLVVGWGGCRGQLTGLGCTPRGKTKKCFVVLI